MSDNSENKNHEKEADDLAQKLYYITFASVLAYILAVIIFAL